MVEDEEMEDVFSMKIGNIPPKETVLVNVSYFLQLDAVNCPTQSHEDDKVVARFILPVLISSRYAPKGHVSKRKFGKPLQPSFSHNISYTFHFSADIKSSTRIQSISSPRQHFSTLYFDKHTLAKVELASHFDFTDDLEMEITYVSANTLTAVEYGRDESGLFALDCVVANFLPRFTVPIEQNAEVIFIIDRSGSMGGGPINQARQSLLVLLKSLPVGCRFQVVGFGSSYNMVFSEPQDYTEANICKALEYQQELQADMGGTEVLPVLKAVYSSKMIGAKERWRREIIFLTDGNVFNHSEIFALVRKNSATTRLSAIGLGNGASTALVSGISRAGRGKALFVRDGGNLREAVLDILNCALQPWVTDVRVNWNLVRSSGSAVDVLQVPSSVSTVFADVFTTVFALVPRETKDVVSLQGDVTLSFKINEELVALKAVLSQPFKETNSDLRLLHRYAAKLQLYELLDRYADSSSDDDLQKIVDLSLSASVLSPFTAFVGLRPEELRDTGRISITTPIGIRRDTCADCLDGVPSKHPGCTCYESCAEDDTVEEEDLEYHDVISGIAEAQLFSGAWRWSDKLAQALSFGPFKERIPPQYANLAEDAWTTALVLAFLATKEINRRVEWQLMAKKAENWLSKAIGTDCANHLINTANQIIMNL
uniref:VWFA domain-containing protein n=2 Tax=Mesocestoides corti TaxID=53468 RepID=A0A5K3EHM4_MESCO